MSDQPTPEEIVEKLLTTDDLFKKFFTSACTVQNNTQAEYARAQEIFLENFPNYHEKEFAVFYHQYCKAKFFSEMQLEAEPVENDELCPKKAFDIRKNSYIKTPRVSNYGRGKQEKFNLSKYLSTKRENGDFFQLSVGDHDTIENFMDQVNEERHRNESPAIIGINAIAEKVAVLNPLNKYKVMELHPEKRVE